MAKIGDWLHWTPRVLAILFALFISLFALDVFVEGFNLMALIGFLIHLVPVYLIIISLLIAWKWEKIGGILFIMLGLVYIMMVWPKFQLITYMAIAGPPILIGFLFLISKLEFKLKETKKPKLAKAEKKTKKAKPAKRKKK